MLKIEACVNEYNLAVKFPTFQSNCFVNGIHLLQKSDICTVCQNANPQQKAKQKQIKKKKKGHMLLFQNEQIFNANIITKFKN